MRWVLIYGKYERLRGWVERTFWAEETVKAKVGKGSWREKGN